jgi:hypothetical protein
MIDKVARNDKEKEKLLVDHILTIKKVNIDVNEFYSTVKIPYIKVLFNLHFTKKSRSG